MRMIKRTDLLQDPHHRYVYGSRRGEHQFVLEIPRPPYDGEEQESFSPVLLAREPLLFENDVD